MKYKKLKEYTYDYYVWCVESYNHPFKANKKIPDSYDKWVKDNLNEYKNN